MDIKGIKITPEEIQEVLMEADPAIEAGFIDDGCKHYLEHRHIILAAITLLGPKYPEMAATLGAIIVILDKACQS